MDDNWNHEVDTYEAFVILRRHFTIRESLLRMLFPFPNYCKKITWAISIAIILVCAGAIVIYGKFFL